VKSFATTVAVNAPAETVWVLPDWNSAVEKIDGRIAPTDPQI
jgi:hypothetical protein